MNVSETLPASGEATPGSASAGVVPEADPWSPDQLRQIERQECRALKRVVGTLTNE
jgi:hypothetical protein